MLAFADRLSNVQVSASTAMTDLARELIDAGQPVINLSSGEPDFPTPRHVIDAAYQAALGGDTKYTAQNGTPALKRAIQRKFKRENRLDYTLDEIIVGNGGRRIATDTNFVAALLAEKHVATVQGSAYGMSPYVRISYATSMEKLREGCGRIAEFCRELA